MADSRRSRDTGAPPEAVWRIWSDVSTWPSWNPDIVSVSLNGPFASGTGGEMTTRSGGRHNVTLQDVQQGRGFTVVADGLPASKLHFRCEVEPAGTGSRISQAVTIHGLFGPLGGMMASRIAPTFEPLLEGLAQAAESAS